jgi:hypothetical protein
MYISISAFYTAVAAELKTAVYDVNSAAAGLAETVVAENDSDDDL